MRQLLKISWRSIWRNRRRTWLTVAAVSLSLSVALFFLALSEGVYSKLLDTVLRMQGGHLTVTHREHLDAPSIDLTVNNLANWRTRIAAHPEVEQTVALIIGQGVASTATGMSAAGIIGVEPSVERQRSPIVDKITDGAYLGDEDQRMAVIGHEMATQLEVTIGSKIVLAANNTDGELVQELVRVKGIFATGTPEIDGHLVQIPIGFARRLFGMSEDQATQIGILLVDSDTQQRTQTQLTKMLATDPTLAVWSWQKVLPDLSGFMQVDKGSNYIFQVIILILMLFTIFNTIMMSVLERSREFAVMLAIGTAIGRIKTQVLCESAMLAALGCLVGVLIGGGSAWWVQVHGWDISWMIDNTMNVGGFALDPVMYTQITTELTLSLVGGVFAAVMVLSLIPMLRIKRIDVAQTMR